LEWHWDFQCEESVVHSADTVDAAGMKDVAETDYFANSETTSDLDCDFIG
jgi:hypothetical protein